MDIQNPDGSQGGDPTGAGAGYGGGDDQSAQGWIRDWLNGHPVPGADPGAFMGIYQRERQDGTAHDQALLNALRGLGWDQWSPQAKPPEPPPPPPPAPVDHTAALGEAPTFTPPAYTKPPAFSYADFVAPDPNKLSEDKGYNYTLKTEQDAIQKSAAARGILNTGGTINDLLLNARDVASQGYQGLFNRDLQTYMTNRGGALDQYNTNYGTQYKDPYTINYQAANDSFNSGLHNYDLSKQYGWMKNLFDFQQNQNQFDRQYQLLQLT